jgi:hypothetical protein
MVLIQEGKTYSQKLYGIGELEASLGKLKFFLEAQELCIAILLFKKCVFFYFKFYKFLSSKTGFG